MITTFRITFTHNNKGVELKKNLQINFIYLGNKKCTTLLRRAA